MLVYWIIFGLFAVGAVSTPAIRSGDSRYVSAYLIVLTVVLALLVGFRYRVGADWTGYEWIFHRAAVQSFWTMVGTGDPAYQALNWVVFRSGADIWAVNLPCGAIFCWGIYRFAREQPSPWLALTFCIPYIVIVVGMGYTRQGVALAIVMAGLAKQARGASALNFAIYVAAASMFHASATVVFPLVALTGKGNRAVNLLATVAVTYILYEFFVGEKVDTFIDNYIRTGLSSQGALIRVTLNIVAAIAFFAARRQLAFREQEYKIWRNFSLAAFAFAVALVLSPSSTAVDRLSLYILPLQVAVLTRVALLGGNQLLGSVAVVSYAMMIQFVWLNYADHARLWIPYQLYPF